MTDQSCGSIDDFDNLVTVLVSSDEQRFTLHQDAVCAKSKFFKAACSKRWREGQEKVVRLPEVEAATFKAYCSWIYSGEIANYTCTKGSAIDERIAVTGRLIDLYLGDKLDDIQLRNQAILRLFTCLQTLNTFPTISATKLIFDSTSPGSRLRKLVVDAYVSRCIRKKFAKNVSRFPPEFVQELAVAALNVAPVLSWAYLAKDLSPYMEQEGSS